MTNGQEEERTERGKSGHRKSDSEQYKPTTVEEMQDALRDIFGPMLEAMLQGGGDGQSPGLRIK